MCPVVDKPAEQKNAARNEPGHDGDTWWVGVGAISLGALTPLSSRSASCSPTADGSGELTCSGVGGGKLQLVQGLPPSITGSFSRNFKVSPTTEPEVPQRLGWGRGA